MRNKENEINHECVMVTKSLQQGLQNFTRHYYNNYAYLGGGFLTKVRHFRVPELVNFQKSLASILNGENMQFRQPIFTRVIPASCSSKWH